MSSINHASQQAEDPNEPWIHAAYVIHYGYKQGLRKQQVWDSISKDGLVDESQFNSLHSDYAKEMEIDQFPGLGGNPVYSTAKKRLVRHCLLYDFQLGKSAAENTRTICAAIGQDAVSYSTANKWFQRFSEGDYSLEDRPRSSRPSTLDTQRLHSLIKADPKRTASSLAEQLDTSHSAVERYLHDQGLEFREGRWLNTSAHSSKNDPQSS